MSEEDSEFLNKEKKNTSNQYLFFLILHTYYWTDKFVYHITDSTIAGWAHWVRLIMGEITAQLYTKLSRDNSVILYVEHGTKYTFRRIISHRQQRMQ